MSEEEDSVILERTLESFEVTFGVLVLVLLIFFAACKGCRRCDSSSQANDVEKDGENARIHHFWGAEPTPTPSRCPTFIVKWSVDRVRTRSAEEDTV